MSMFGGFLTSTPSQYEPPSWISNADLKNIPAQKLSLGRFPTPLHSFIIPELRNKGVDCFIKRDDLSSCDLSGNKVRKLEFLLAAALRNNHDCVITPGGLQSNHARATAVAARQLGLDSYLILRKSKSKDGTEDEIGLTGNLLFDRLVGANIVLIEPSSYARLGSDAVCEQFAEQLRAEGRNPYVIPVGGSNAMGAFGYIECVRELITQTVTVVGAESSSSSTPPQLPTHYDHIVFGCGSGGTAAGIALGVRLSGLQTHIHAIGVCDSPDEFYHHIEVVAAELGVDPTRLGSVRQWCSIYQGQGAGYARSTTEELSFLVEVAGTTGILLDPVYSGKALYHFVKHVVEADEHGKVFQPGQKVLFIHTGGTFGLYDKESQLLPLLPAKQVTRMQVQMPRK